MEIKDSRVITIYKDTYIYTIEDIKKLIATDIQNKVYNSSVISVAKLELGLITNENREIVIPFNDDSNFYALEVKTIYETNIINKSLSLNLKDNEI